MTEQEIRQYLTLIINSTWGFIPSIEVNFPTAGTVQVFLDGSPAERSDLMGKESRNLHAIKQLLRIFSRKRGVFSYIYIKPPQDEKNTA